MKEKRKLCQVKESSGEKKSSAEIVQNILDIPPSPADPEGSYTGRPVGEETKPVQDADDL